MLRRLALVLPLSLLVLAPAAFGSFPGGNGRIVYQVQADSSPAQVGVVDPGSLLATPFIPDTNFNDEHPSWSPNGARVVMTRQGLTGDTNFHAWVANADGSGLRQVTFGASTADPAWAPDGHRIVFIGADALYTLNIDDPADTPHQIPGTDASSFGPAWSPDGALIAFEHENSSSVGEIDVVAPDGNGEHAVATGPNTTVNLEQPAWSPDGSRIYYAQGAFLLGCVASPPFQIYSVARTGGMPVLFSKDPSVSEYGPAPSPDGKQIAYSRCDDPTNDLDHVWAAGIDGSGAHALTHGDTYDNQANWQPAAPQISSLPTLSGNGVNNQTLTAGAGGVGGATSTTLQFERCNAQGAACLAIPGASASRAHAAAASASYKLTSADIGHAVRVHEVDTNSIGNSIADSATTKAVTPSRGRCSNRFAGTAKADRIKGSAGSDKITGGRGKDRLSGLAGVDCISGGAGNDRLSGGRGNDSLSGGAGNDMITAGPGRNKVSGGAGNDRINVRNHKRDVVNCGKGKKDRVVADKKDKLRGCEKVKRRR